MKKHIWTKPKSELKGVTISLKITAEEKFRFDLLRDKYQIGTSEIIRKVFNTLREEHINAILTARPVVTNLVPRSLDALIKSEPESISRKKKIPNILLKK